ncbi:TetR/AcrR family transcriptional regulator [Neobacillus sp. OS1-33]|uniref:TetR/AcrR family transcriptional regulator n=1 Tax=Neobacillus sp. OS1-33 TaxID=3070683 RepID=UPI0027E2018D|nr:TetR/AcrR family transcriptional regulator [Neobacillus sp. OS1-33]WML24961.1 TetR/AcrR family transcriptional regulator [Neobacillus sp. OS1-33]
MSGITPRKIKARQTRKKILETALFLFSKKPFDKTTVDEIVKLSGTSKGAFYTHFKSKYEIFLEKFKEIDEFYLELTQSLPEEKSATEKLMLFSESQMIFLRDCWGKELFHTLYTNASPDHNYFMDQKRVLPNIINQFVTEGQKSGEIKEDLSANEISILIMRCMRGTLFDWCISPDDLDLILETRKLMRTIIEGLKS